MIRFAATARGRFWQTAPLHSSIIFDPGVFNLFAIFGILADILRLSRQPIPVMPAWAACGRPLASPDPYAVTAAMRLRASLLSTALILVASPVLAAPRVECDTVSSRFVHGAVDYCALLPAGYDAQPARRFPVLYFLHGLGDDHRSLVHSGGWSLVQELQARRVIGEFVIITPNAGRTFYINARDGRTRYEDFFLREFLPAMERKYRIGTTRRQRGISGISMGGYGALRTAFKHPQVFGSVSAHSAALMETMVPGAASAGITGFLGRAFGVPFDAEFWRRNTPFAFARSADLTGLKIYFDCGDRDEYGFDKGLRDLDKLLTSRKIPHQAVIRRGGHDWRYFAAQLPDSLAFHSRAFGLPTQLTARASPSGSR
jgi:S-formylglutathione hydrolase FrmB